MSDRVVYPGAVVGGSAGGMDTMIKKERCPSCGSDDITKTAKIWKCNNDKCGRESRNWYLKKCAKCNTTTDADDVFCTECGSKLGPAPKGQRMTENTGGLSTQQLFK